MVVPWKEFDEIFPYTHRLAFAPSLPILDNISLLASKIVPDPCYHTIPGTYLVYYLVRKYRLKMLLNLTYFPDYISNPDELPRIHARFRYWSDFAMIVLLPSSFHRFLNMRYEFPFFFFTGKTVRIEPTTSLLIISRPAVDANVWK